MSRRHRHYRKHKGSAQPVRVANESATQSTTVAAIDHNISIVRQDLTRTAIITALLLIALVLLSVINAKQQWTLGVGSQLYSLLHIR